MELQLLDHQYNSGGWRTPNSNDLDPVVCLLNDIRYDCSPVNGPLVIKMLAADVVSGFNQIRLDTEYIDPYNGIKYPDVAGMYEIILSLIPASGAAASVSFYCKIYPPHFLNMQAASIVKDIATESVYKLNLTLPTWHVYPNSYADAVNYSRILIEFPTK